MKTVRTLIASAGIGLGSTTMALAAEAGRQDNSQGVIWGFLGFCALIVIAQLVPTIRELRQAARAERQRRILPVGEKSSARK